MKPTIKLVMVMMMVVVVSGYERTNRRSNSHTTTSQPSFDEVNVVKFNRNRWRQNDNNNLNNNNNNDDDNNNGDEEEDESIEDISDNKLFGDLFGNSLGSLDTSFGQDLFPGLSTHSIFIDSSSLPNPSNLGPNMCHDRRVHERTVGHRYGGFMSTSCTFLDGQVQCNQSTSSNGKLKTIVNTWKCCEGYTKDHMSQGCPIVEKDTNLECLRHNNMSEWITALETFQLGTYLDGPYTIFAPDDEAIKEFKEQLDQQTANVLVVTPEMEEAAKTIESRLLSHLFPGVLSISDFTGVKRTTSAFNSSDTFLFRHSAGATLQDLDVSVNCKRLNPVYTSSTEGRVYVLHGFLAPLKRSFNDVIKNNDDANEFRELTEAANFTEMVEAGQTIFVPTNKALENLGDWAKNRIKENPLEFIKSLVVAAPLCPHQFKSGTSARTTNGELVRLTVQDGVYKVNKVDTEAKEVVTSEGAIVYFIDSLFNLDSLSSPVELSKKLGATTFAEMMKENNFDDVRDQHFTMVVPSNEALEKLDDTEDKASFIKHHTITTPLQQSGPLQTDNGDQVFYRRFMLGNTMKKLIQCIPLHLHKSGLGYDLYTAQKTLPKTQGTILQMLEDDPDFSIFHQLVKFTQLDDFLQESHGHRLTLLAPDDETFNQQLTSDDLERLKNNKEAARILVMNHILKTEFCTNDPEDDFVVTLKNSRQRYLQWKAQDGEVRVGDALIDRARSDRVGSNGVLHVVKGLYLQQPRRNVYFTFFDI